MQRSMRTMVVVLGALLVQGGQNRGKFAGKSLPEGELILAPLRQAVL
jgi:hypothetical protein